ncbi:unnamed protein product [Tenebrio molitor]|nr:unnamed protein product [Tenebrio molitor]
MFEKMKNFMQNRRSRMCVHVSDAYASPASPITNRFNLKVVKSKSAAQLTTQASLYVYVFM